MASVEIPIVNPLIIVISSFHLLLYFAFTIQMFWYYRIKIKEYYSNTYKLELNWVRNFIILFLILFTYDIFQNIIDSFIIDLHWTQKWWYHFLSGIIIVYFGIKGYFTKINALQDINFSFEPYGASVLKSTNKVNYEQDIKKLDQLMLKEKPFLNAELNLSEMADLLGTSSSWLSEIINGGKNMNFNDFINSYRVEEVKRQLDDEKHKVITLVSIAYDSGFNSKATFNRVFKKMTGVSPTEYIRSRS
jgi:AraC-like DNA-binding protein